MSEAWERTRSDSMSIPLMEERLKEEEDKPDPRDGPIMPLKKSSGEMAAGWARFGEGILRNLLETHPEHFRALRALVEGRGADVDKTLRRDLKRWSYLLRDGSPHPELKAIMLASVRDTPDGPCVVEPLEVRTPEEASTVHRFDEQRDARRSKGAERLFRLLSDGNRDEGKGPSR